MRPQQGTGILDANVTGQNRLHVAFDAQTAARRIQDDWLANMDVNEGAAWDALVQVQTTQQSKSPRPVLSSTARQPETRKHITQRRSQLPPASPVSV